MSPFIIFAIVLTIAYILYYATLITMDLNAKPKDAEKATETISADDGEEEESGIKSRNVIEDTESGGFNIMEPSTSSDDGGIVEEATDHAEDILQEETPEVPPATLPSNDEEDEIEESEEEEEEQEDNGISTIPFEGTSSEDDGEDKPFEETDAFNPDLAQPHYGISAIVGNPVDAAVQKNVDDLNQVLLTNHKPKGNLKAPEEFVSLINARRENSNIDYHDEYTQC